MKTCKIRLFEKVLADETDSLSAKGAPCHWDEADQGVWEVPAGMLLSDFLHSALYSIRLDCGGHGRCGKCKVDIAPLNPDWKKDQSFEQFSPAPQFCRVRSCQTKIEEDLLILVPFEAIAKNERILEKYSPSLPAAPPEYPSGKLGVAVDLGTTTIVMALVDLCNRKTLLSITRRNPQMIHGADIVSRMQYALAGLSHANEMQKLVLNLISESISEMLLMTGQLAKDVIKISVAGNSVMSHFFLGLDVSPLSQFPFTPKCKTFPIIPSDKTPLPVCPKAEVMVVPLFAGFVGGDIVAGVIANRLTGTKRKRPERELFLDLGTNGEIVLFNGKKIHVAATAAGPAFEGAGIRFGMVAQKGAIASFDLANPAGEGEEKHCFRTIGNIPPVGICGSGLVDAIASLLRFHLLDAGGRFRPPHESEVLDNFSGLPFDNRFMEFEGQKAFLLTGDKSEPVWLTQKDVRQVQLAAGAIRAGARLVVQESGLVMSDIQRISLAGSFGNVLDISNACRIGLLPDEIDRDHIQYIGNASLEGAIWILYRPELWYRAMGLVRNVHHIDLATLSNFESVYIDSLVFPRESEQKRTLNPV